MGQGFFAASADFHDYLNCMDVSCSFCLELMEEDLGIPGTPREFAPSAPSAPLSSASLLSTTSASVAIPVSVNSLAHNQSRKRGSLDIGFSSVRKINSNGEKVTWYKCDQAGCEYKTKQTFCLKIHKEHKHNNQCS